jgi:predicted transcriptional regulator
MLKLVRKLKVVYWIVSLWLIIVYIRKALKMTIAIAEEIVKLSSLESAIKIIDDALLEIVAQTICSTVQMSDTLLDIRQLITQNMLED